MARNLINNYVWLVDTLTRYGRLTGEQLLNRWMRSTLSDGRRLTRRTLYNYRQAVAELFDIDIVVDRTTNEYYIAHDGGEARRRYRDWMIDSVAISGVLSDTREISNRIVLENVPSARENLPIVIDALKQNRRISFSYHSYMRSQANEGVVIEPYFVKLFKQLWYVIGYNVNDRMIKTYSLDRMSRLVISDRTFVMPSDFSAQQFFADCFGIITNRNTPKDIVLRVDPTQAKYLRALPLHESQREVVHDNYSLFTYRMRITYDLREEILSHGSTIEVVSPPELKTAIVTELRNALANYS